MAAMTDVEYYFITFLLVLTSTFILQYILRRLTKHSTHLCLPPIQQHINACTLHNLCSKYGPLLYLRLGSFPVLLVSSASMANEIFKTHDLNFAYKPKSPFEDSILFGTSSFCHAPYGDYWRFMKKLCLTELLGARQLERSRGVRREELEVVDLSEEIMTLTNNITYRMVMSARCSGQDNDVEKCVGLVRESFQLVAKMTLANLLGPLRKVGVFFFGEQLLDVPRRFDELLERIMEEHEERARRDGGEIENKDLMDIVLEAHHDKDAEVKISRTQMKSFFLDLFFGGTSTTAHSMQWLMAEMINHPQVFKKLREEIDSVVGRNRLVEDSGKLVLKKQEDNCPYKWQRGLSLEDCKFGGFDVPKGTLAVVNSHSVMRDPEVWDNPDEFYPERFLLAIPKEEADDKMGRKGQDLNFWSFGGGRRKCPGVNLAFSLINATVAAMVQCFDWKLDGAEYMARANMEVTSGVTMSMAHPLLCLPVVHFNPFNTPTKDN
uniref:Cytochrome P450 n=1 Tax=Populus trichocarpa TaxID=3694 RepID=A0A2K1Z3U4_POPTR